MARKMCLTILGHSNAEGFAGSSPMIAAAAGWLDTVGSPGGPSADLGVAKFVYKNIKVFTTENPFGGGPNHSPRGGADGTGDASPRTSPGWRGTGDGHWSPTYDLTGSPYIQSPAGVRVGAWLDMTTYSAQSPADPHPHGSPYQYSNTRSVPAPPSVYRADGNTYTPWGNSYGDAGGGSLVGVELPLCWKLSHHFGDETIYLVKLAVPGSLLLREDSGLGTISNNYWWSPLDNFDWHPATDRLYLAWKNKMTGAAEQLDAGDSLDVRLVVLWVGDNDSNQTSPRVTYFNQVYRQMIKQIREDLVDNDWTSLPKHQIPIAMIGIHKAYDNSGQYSTLNNIIRQIEQDDAYTKWVKSDNWELLSEAGITDPALGPGGHFSHNGYLTAANDIYNAFLVMEDLGEDPLGLENRVDREEVRTRVLNYYERGSGRTDSTTTVVNQHINAALFHILNRVGDNAYWLRRLHRMTLSGDISTAVDLPKTVHRLLRIEGENAPDYPLQFTLLGHTDGGRMRILLKERYTGNFDVHFITRPPELSRDDENVPLPYDLVEWLVVETCRRLARASGNIPLQAALQSEAAQLQADCMRNMQAVRRAAHDRLHSQRRLPVMRHGRVSYRFSYPYYL